MKRFIRSKRLADDILKMEDGQAEHYAALEKRRPSRLRPNYQRQKASLDFMKAKWTKGDEHVGSSDCTDSTLR